MRSFAQVLPTNFRRSPWVAFGFLLFAVVAAYEVSEYILASDTAGLMYMALFAIGGVIVVTILNNWRKGVYFFLVWLLFEDFARKYLGNNMTIYFAKDFLVLVVFISFFAACRRNEVKQTFRPPFLVPLLILVWFGFIQVFNPASTSFAYGVMGIKMYFFYIPLVYVGYSLLESETDLRRFFFFNLALALVIGGLGIAQAILGHTFLNPETAADELRELSTLYRVAPISGVRVYRPTSVFVSDGRFGSYMTFSWILAFSVGAYLLLRNRKGRLFATCCLGVLTVAVALSGSRGTLLWTFGSGLVCVAAFMWSSSWKQSIVVRVIRTLQRSILFGALALLCLLLFNPDALLSRYAFYWETLSLGSPQSELVFRVRDYPMQNFLGAFADSRWPYGYGIGTASLGVQYVARFFHAPPPTGGTENGYGQLILELGIFGLVLWIIMSIAVVSSCWKIVRKLKGSPWFPLAFAIFWYAFLVLFPLTYNGLVQYQNFVQNAYLWLLIGILFRLPSIASSAQFASMQSTERTLPRCVR
jgi:DMSO/TMAO reductase YedYZ heme-binding membrane subunit